MKTITSAGLRLCALLFFQSQILAGFNHKDSLAGAAPPDSTADAAPSSLGKCDVFTSMSCGSTFTHSTVGQGNDFVLADYPTLPTTAAMDGPDRLYKLTLTARSSVHLLMTITTPGIDLDLMLLTSCTTPFLKAYSVEDNVGLGINFESIDVNLDAGTYYLVVDGYNSSQQGSYTVKADCACNCLEASGDMPTGEKYWCDDFGNYNNNQALNPQSSRWRRWDFVGTGSGDALVTNSGNSGNKYARFQYNATAAPDLIYSFSEGNANTTPGFTTGRYRMSWRMLVPSNKKGYFNVLHKWPDASGNGANWAYHVFFNNNGSGQGSLVVGNGDNPPLATFYTPLGNWFNVVQIIDLNTDRAELWINNAYVGQWQFSIGDNTNLLQLAGVDFYAGDDTAMDFYLDDLCIWRQPPGADCSNLPGPYQVCLPTGGKYESPAAGRCALYTSAEFDGCFSICDFGGTLIYRAEPRTGKFGLSDRIPGALRDMCCVQAAYGGSVPDDLYCNIYVFYNDQPTQDQFVLWEPPPGSATRCFVMQCHNEYQVDARSGGAESAGAAILPCAYGAECVATCSPGSTTKFYDPDGSLPNCAGGRVGCHVDPFFYVAFVGPLNDSYSNFQIFPTGKCPPAGVPPLPCGTTDLAGTVDAGIDSDTHFAKGGAGYPCYDGVQTYVGGEAFFRVEVTQPQKVSFKLKADDPAQRMGMFLFSNVCGEDCIDYAGTDVGPGDATLDAVLETGIYYLIVDKDTKTGNPSFHISLSCQTVTTTTTFVTFDEYMNQPDCPYQAGGSHQIELPNPAAGSYHFDTSTFVQLLFPTTGNYKKTISAMSKQWTEPSNLSGFFTAYGDLSGDGYDCGFEQSQNDSITIRAQHLDNAGADHYTSFNVVWAPVGGGNNAGKYFQAGGTSAVTKLVEKENVTFSLSNNIQLFGPNPATATLIFHNNRAWHVVNADGSTMPTWLEVTPASASAGVIAVEIKTKTANNTPVPRKALLRFYADLAPNEYNEFLQVEQSGICTDVVGLQVTASPSATICNGQSVTLTATTPPGTQGLYNYYWSDNLPRAADITVTPSTPTTYKVTVSAACGKYQTAEITVVVKNPPTVAANGGTITCQNPSATLTVSTNATQPTFSWSGPGGFTSPLQNPTVTVAGTYTVTVTPGGGAAACTATATATVVGNGTVPQALATTDGAISCVTPTATVCATSSNVPNAVFSWSGPGGFSSSMACPPVGTAGSYTVTVTNPANGCTAAVATAVTGSTTAPMATATGGALSCSVGSVQISAATNVGGATFAWSAPGFSSSLQNPTVTTAGSYTVTITNPANGCTATATATVNSDNNLPNATATASGALTCTAQTVALSGSSTSGGTTFFWTRPDNSTSTSNPLSASLPGTYVFHVKFNASGCESTVAVTVFEDKAAPGATATGGTLTCAAPSVQLTGTTTSGTGWNWTGPGNFSSTAQNPMATSGGAYFLTVTGANGCTSTASTTVSENKTAPVASISPQNAALTCATTSLSLTATGNVGAPGFVWSGPGIAGSGASAGVTVTLPGSYVVTITDPSNGCTGTASATVGSDTNLPNASASGATLTCANLSTASLSGSSTTTGVTFSWTGPNNFQSASNPTTVTTAGDYVFHVKSNATGCSTTVVVKVVDDKAPPGATATASGTITCSNPTASLNAATATGTVFLWTGPNGFGSAEQGPTVALGGTYFLTVTAPNGCTSTASATVGENKNPPIASIAQPAAALSCSVPSLALDASASSQGQPGFAYMWTGGSIVSGAATLVPTVNQAATYTLLVTNTSTGCTNSASVSVAGNGTIPAVNAGPAQAITCALPAVQLAGLASSGPNFTYLWSPSAGIVSGAATLSPVVNQPGNYCLTVTNTANGCTNSACAPVADGTTSPSVLVLPFDTATITCELNKTVVLAGSYGPAGQSAKTEWFDAGGSKVGFAPSLTVAKPGAYTFKVTLDWNGCSASKSVHVGIDTVAPSGGAGLDKLLCLGDGWTLGVGNSPAFVYSWSPPGLFADPTLPSPPIMPQATQTFSVLITNPANHCTTADAAKISVSPPMNTIVAVAGAIKCHGDKNGKLLANTSGGTPPITYKWSNNAVGSLIADLDTATYSVTATDAAGCTSTSSFVLSQPDMIIAGSVTLTPAKPGESDGSINVNVSGGAGGYLYQWFNGVNLLPGETQAYIVNQMAMLNYFLQVTDANGCKVLLGPYNILVESSEPDWASGLQIFPNPTGGLLDVRLDLTAPADLSASVFDALGREILRTDGGRASSADWRLDLSDRPAGLYAVRITVDGASVSRAVAVVR